VNHLGLPLFRLCYEDLLGKKDESLERLFQFLGARPMSVRGQTLKITSDDLRAAIVNFDQLRANYVGTQYEPMFDEVLLPTVATANQ
jgi:hypothetical protein